jgi:mRNA interferase MazF
LDFNPQSGHEQAGRRPALVLSPEAYNRKVGLMLCCPITSHAKGYPFEVDLKDESGIEGVVLADQVKSVDWVARRAERKGHVSEDVLLDVLNKVLALLDDSSED